MLQALRLWFFHGLFKDLARPQTTTFNDQLTAVKLCLCGELQSSPRVCLSQQQRGAANGGLASLVTGVSPLNTSPVLIKICANMCNQCRYSLEKEEKREAGLFCLTFHMCEGRSVCVKLVKSCLSWFKRTKAGY